MAVCFWTRHGRGGSGDAQLAECAPRSPAAAAQSIPPRPFPLTPARDRGAGDRKAGCTLLAVADLMVILAGSPTLLTRPDHRRRRLPGVARLGVLRQPVE
ncbi:hypothetical protein GCM10027072_64300 [Streptomyces bullii]